MERKGLRTSNMPPTPWKRFIVKDNDIDYSFKSTDRTCLNRLATQKGDCDEIIIIKNGLVTDTSFTNIAIYKHGMWLTPKHPLLLGTKRAALLEKGIIQEADITVDDLMKAEKVSLFNAMIDFGQKEVMAHDIYQDEYRIREKTIWGLLHNSVDKNVKLYLY